LRTNWSCTRRGFSLIAVGQCLYGLHDLLLRIGKVFVNRLHRCTELFGLLLIEQIFPPESKERKRVERFISLVKKTDALGDYITLSERLVSLGDEASEMEREALAADLIAWMKRLMHAADKEDPAEEGSSEDGNEDAYGILDMFDRETLNQAQMDVSLRVQKALASAFGPSS